MPGSPQRRMAKLGTDRLGHLYLARTSCPTVPSAISPLTGALPDVVTVPKMDVRRFVPATHPSFTRQPRRCSSATPRSSTWQAR